jgi:Ca2+-binding RTX toxin-like protein
LIIQQAGTEPVVLSAGGTITATAEGTTVIGDEVQIDSPTAPVFHTSSMAVFGTPSADHIQFRQGSTAGSVEAFVNGVSRGVIQSATRLIAHGLGGDDDIEVVGNVQTSAWLYGDDGDDRMKGGAGHDVLLGGDGDDLLVGGQGRDILIGQLGADRMVGNADDDILIAGTTDFDANDAALSAILAEWTSSRSYSERTANITGNGSGGSFAARMNGNVFLNVDAARGPVTVHDDNANDTLTGSAGQDWFFANLFLDNGDDAQQKDKITDLSASEFALDLDFIGTE